MLHCTLYIIDINQGQYVNFFNSEPLARVGSAGLKGLAQSPSLISLFTLGPVAHLSLSLPSTVKEPPHGTFIIKHLKLLPIFPEHVNNKSSIKDCR